MRLFRKEIDNVLGGKEVPNSRDLHDGLFRHVICTVRAEDFPSLIISF